MNEILQTTWLDYPDNYSLAVIFYTYGCIHKCKNCHNLALQTPVLAYSKELLKEILMYCKRNNTNKLVLSGGDCLLKGANLDLTNSIIDQYKNQLDICIYTGYDIDYVKANVHQGFKFVKCGKYEENLKIESEKTDDFLQLASTNQELYDANYKLLSTNGRYYFSQGERNE